MAKKKRRKARTVTARDWGVVSLICRSGGKGKHKSKKHQARSTAKAALKKSLMRNHSHEAFLCVHTVKSDSTNALPFYAHSL